MADRTRLARLTAERMRSRIVDGSLQPGTSLGTRDSLRQEWSVGRATVDEALRLLADGGVVEVRRGRGGGVYVQDVQRVEGVPFGLIDRTTSEQLLEVHEALREDVVGRIASRADEREVRELQFLLERLTAALPTVDTNVLATIRSALGRLHDNPFLWHIFALTLERAADGPEASADAHRDVLRAVLESTGAPGLESGGSVSERAQ